MLVPRTMEDEALYSDPNIWASIGFIRGKVELLPFNKYEK